MAYTLDEVTSLAMSMEETFLGPVPGAMSRRRTRTPAARYGNLRCAAGIDSLHIQKIAAWRLPSSR